MLLSLDRHTTANLEIASRRAREETDDLIPVHIGLLGSKLVSTREGRMWIQASPRTAANMFLLQSSGNVKKSGIPESYVIPAHACEFKDGKGGRGSID